MPDSITLDVEGLHPNQVSALLDQARAYRTANLHGVRDDETWRQAESTGWSRAHVELLRENLRSRGKIVQLEGFDLAVRNGGFVSREEVYAIGGYAPTRKLNNWTLPFSNFCDVLVQEHGLPDSAAWPVVTEYGEGAGYRPAIGFSVAPEIVKLMRH